MVDRHGSEVPVNEQERSGMAGMRARPYNVVGRSWPGHDGGEGAHQRKGSRQVVTHSKPCEEPKELLKEEEDDVPCMPVGQK